jgi:hypothetical protein
MMTDKPSDYIIAALEGIHEWSMSGDTQTAVTGRCLKEFYEPFDNFDRQECDRGIHRGVVIYGMVHAMAIIAATTALSGVKDGYEEHAINNTADLFKRVVTDVLNAKKNRRVDGENT